MYCTGTGTEHSVPDLDPMDLKVFGPPGTGSVDFLYGSGFGSGSESGSCDFIFKKVTLKLKINTVPVPVPKYRTPCKF
jgi:hypothetical protein